MKSAKTMRRVNASALLRSFVAVVLCCGLMIPTNVTAPATAYADTNLPAANDPSTYTHGNIAVASDDATDGVIELTVGETATVTVTPYEHVQYKGCGRSECPDECESAHGVECFVPGMGCKCDHEATPRTASVTATSADTAVATVSDVVADAEYVNAGNLDLHDSTKPVTKNGTITVTATKAGETTVAVSATDLDHWSDATATYTVKVKAAENNDSKVTFSDVEPDAWYAEAVSFVAAKGLIRGYEGTTLYGVSNTLTRAELAVILWRYFDPAAEAAYDGVSAKNTTGMADVVDNTWYTAAANWAVDNGVINGKVDASGKRYFDPQATVEFQELVSMLVNMTASKAEVDATDAASLNTFTDSATVADWAEHTMAYALNAGLYRGYPQADGTVQVAANEDVMRVRAAGVLMNGYKCKMLGVEAGATLVQDSGVALRYTGDPDEADLSVENLTDEWVAAVTSVSVAPINADGTVGTPRLLAADQYSFNSRWSELQIVRTEADPIFSVAVGEGSPYTVTNRWGEEVTYPQSKQYQVTIAAKGYQKTTATVTAYTGASDTFSIIVDEDGDEETTDDQKVIKTYTKDQMDALSSFSNGSSQCGMTGFRTFSAKGVALSDLFKDAGVSVSATDAFKLDTTDDFGRTFSYDQLFGDRYFLQSIYDDQEVKDTYATLVKSDDEAGATVQLRRLLAQKALEDNSIAKPMISSAYAETMISGDEVATATLPTEENTHISSLVGAENQYRFTYGISLVQEDHKVTFNAGEGVDAPEVQTVKSHLMTSTENTTIRSTYWNNAIVVYRNAAEAAEPSTAADKISKPADPTRTDGAIFQGWYTKDGSATGDWGEKFDFDANDGTVDVDTTIYAKWAVDQSVQPSFASLESDHDYDNNLDKEYTYTWKAAGTFGMALTFDEQTAVENGYDFITISDGAGNVLGKYTGTELAGATVYVPQTDTVKIKLTSDQSGVKWGFKVTNVEALTSNDLTLAGSIAPISAQYLSTGAAPEPVVTYGAKTLVKGTDYTVSHAGNDTVGQAMVVVKGIGNYTGMITRYYDVVDDSHLATGAELASGQQVLLRQSGEEGSTSLKITGATDEWAQAITSVEVAPVGTDGKVGEATVLTSDQYEASVANGRIYFNRTEDAPVFTVAIGEGGPIEIAGRWGSTTYPQHKDWQVTVKADGYTTLTGSATFYTGASDTFSIIVDEDGDAKTTDDQKVIKTYTKDQMDALSSFSNGSSQCGMTGFRTFSAKGVALSDLFKDAGVSVSATDAFKLDTTDDFGRTFSYDQLFGDRYFLQSIYDDQEVKDTYATLVKSDDEAGATVQLRRLLAQKALEDNSIAKPMISSAYAETMISGDEVATATLPTEENTHISSLVGAENQYRFTYGISLVQEDHKVTFNAGEGVDAPEVQTVKSHLMTSTENTTIRSTYWNNAIVVYRNAAEAAEPSTAADKISKPADPTRTDGAIFQGWYTKDGSATGDWGEKFDFDANDGTVDVDTTLYAKWAEPVSQTGVEAAAWREASYGNPPEGDSSNAGQHATITLAFDGPVTVSDAAALLESMNVSCSGATTWTAKADGNNLVLDTTLGFALMGGYATVSAKADNGILSGVSVDGRNVKLTAVETLVDTGLAFEAISVKAGTATECASTTYKVTHGANVRSMNHVVWMSNGASILSNEEGGAAQSTTAHHHMWYKFTGADSASSIQSNAAEYLDAAGYTVTCNEDTFTITAKTAKAGEILSADTYTNSFFNKTGLKYGEDVKGVVTPAATA